MCFIQVEIINGTQDLKKNGIVLYRIRESGFEDSNLFANFAGERKIRIFNLGFESLLPGKKSTQKVRICPIFGDFQHFFPVNFSRQSKSRKVAI